MHPALPIVRKLSLALAIGAACPLISASAPPPPVPGGPIGTLILGQYSCELPGDAGGPVSVPTPEYDFRIINSSSYRTGDGMRGSYLRTGNTVVMTGGALAGLRLRRTSDAFLREVLPDGTDGDMRCVLTRRRNS